MASFGRCKGTIYKTIIGSDMNKIRSLGHNSSYRRVLLIQIDVYHMGFIGFLLIVFDSKNGLTVSYDLPGCYRICYICVTAAFV